MVVVARAAAAEEEDKEEVMDDRVRARYMMRAGVVQDVCGTALGWLRYLGTSSGLALAWACLDRVTGGCSLLVGEAVWST